MKLKRVLGGILVLVVALVVAGGVYLYYAVDRDEIRRIVEERAEQATGRKLVLAGPIDLGISLTPTVSVAEVSFANADWGSRPEMAKIGTFEVQLALMPLLSGDVEVQRIVLRGADILLETDKEGRANWQFETAGAKPAAEAPAEPGEPATGRRIEVASLTILDSQLLYRDGRTGESLALRIDRLEATGKGQAIGLDFDGSYQEAPIELTGEIGSLAALRSGGDFPLRLSGKLNEATLSLEGQIRSLGNEPSPDLRFALAGKSFALLTPFTGAPLPAIGPFDVSGHLSGGGKSYRVSGLAATVASSDLAGDVAVSLAGRRPKLTAKLTSALIDLRDFTASGEGGTAAPAPAQGGGKDSPYVIPDRPLPLEALRALDAELDAKVGTLRLNERLQVAEIATRLALAGGKLAVSGLAARFYEGLIEGKLTLDASRETPSLATAMTLKGLDYGDLLRSFEVTDKVRGKVDAVLDLKGAGKTPHAIAGSLNGKSEVIGGEGIITNKLLAIVATGLDQVLGPLLGGQEETKLNCVVTRFLHEKGVMRSQAMVLDSSTFAIAGAGTLDLKTEALDMRFDTATRQAALASLAVPFLVSGTLKSPKVKPDPLGAAAKVGQALGAQSGILGQLQGVVGQQGQQGQQATIVENPCEAALSGKPVTAAPAAQPAPQPPAQQQPAQQQPADTLKQLQEDPAKGVQDAIKGLFKN